MNFAKNKTAAISIVILFIISMGASTMLIPNATAHSPPWQIPTYAYIVATPDPVGVGQTVTIYLWLDPVYGVAGGATPVAGTNGTTASAALLSNTYRFHNYQLTITPPNGTATTQTFPVITDTTSSMYTTLIPTDIGTYTLNFTYPGQVYGADGNGYSGSSLINDTYLPSNATATITVQQQPIPAPVTGFPLPTEYWTRPIYGENTNWYSIASNWLGTGAAVNPAYGSGTITGFAQSQMNRYPGDAVGSQTAHIMWTKPLEMGGVVGGQIGSSTLGLGYFEGSAYNNRVQNPIIIDGILYYTEPVSLTGITSGPTDAVDLRTGKLLWSNSNIPSLSFGYVYSLYNGDQHGVYPPILFTSNFAQGFDAYTGAALFNVTGVPTGMVAMGPSGEQLRYVFANTGNTTNPQWYLAEWNSSRLWQQSGSNPYTSGSSLLSPAIINATNGALVTTFPIPITGTTGTLPTGTSISVPYGSTLTVNANIPINSTTNPGNGISTTTYDWNVSASWVNTMPLQPGYNTTSGLTIPATPGSNPVTVLAAFPNNMLLCRNGSLPIGFAANNVGYPQLPFTFFAVNLNASLTGHNVGDILWTQTYNPPAGNLTLAYGGADPTAWNGNGYGVFIVAYAETRQWTGYSMSTGAQIWGPTASQPAFDYYGNPIYPYLTGQVAYGNLYCSGFAGVCFAYNLTTGNVEWTYGNGGAGNSTNAGLNTFYGDYPTFINAVGNGVIYLVTTEHTITDPIYKGALARAINATDGTEIWTLSDYTGEFGSMSYAIADGYNTMFNGYDDQLYTVGRGTTTTTVTASPATPTLGNNVVITGTVMDTSAGTMQNQQAANFPKGVPVASDASMTAWMGYVYQQKPLPTNFTGVPVTISVLDSNNNFRSIGTATTDANGAFSFTWKPDISGDYKLYATFAGTNGYWPSNSETAINTMQTSATTPPTSSPTNLATTTDLLTYIAVSAILIIIAIAIVGILLLRKHP